MEQDNSSEALLKEIERLREEIKRVREDIDQSYYSIPKKEFENITVNRINQEVTEQMSRKINTWRNVFLIVISILSFLGISQWGKLKEGLENDMKKDIEHMEIKNASNIETKINETRSGINSDLKDFLTNIREQQKELREEQKNNLILISKSVLDVARNAATEQTNTQIKNIRDEIEIAEKTAVRYELNTLRGSIENKLITHKEALDKLEPLLRRAIKINDRDLINEFLDELFRWTFVSGNYEKLDELRTTYEINYKFKATTWANIAIGDMSLYDEGNAPIYKERAIGAYKKALEESPNYGLPHAVRLIIHMIDYERQKDQNIKEREKSEALNLINMINSGRIPSTAFETYDYIDRNINIVDSIGKYIGMLFESFPNEMEVMHKRSEEYSLMLEKSKKSIK